MTIDRDKATEDYISLASRGLAHTLDTKSRPPPGYIKVAKPHIQQVFTVPGNRGMWRCTGSFGTVQYGGTPSQAYAAWRMVMEQGHGTLRQPAGFRFNYMRKD